TARRPGCAQHPGPLSRPAGGQGQRRRSGSYWCQIHHGESPIMTTTAAAIGQPYHITPDGGLSLDFHPGQWDAWDSAKRFIFVIAGTQGGKTSFGPHWLYREIYHPE